MSSQNEETPSADKQDIQDDGNASGVVQNELVERQNLIFRILEAKAKNEALNYKFNFIDYKFKQSQQKLEVNLNVNEHVQLLIMTIYFSASWW